MMKKIDFHDVIIHSLNDIVQHLKVHMTNINTPNSVFLQDHFVYHTAGDCGPNLDGNTFDEFALMHFDKEVCTLRIDYENDTESFSTKLIVHDKEHQVPMCAGSFHIIASMMNTVMHHFTSDHEFYCDAFSNEDGDTLGHALIVVM